eukprot:354745-Chlamydomonas_euryale.AAC.2
MAVTACWGMLGLVPHMHPRAAPRCTPAQNPMSMPLPTANPMSSRNGLPVMPSTASSAKNPIMAARELIFSAQSTKPNMFSGSCGSTGGMDTPAGGGGGGGTFAGGSARTTTEEPRRDGAATAPRAGSDGAESTALRPLLLLLLLRAGVEDTGPAADERRRGVAMSAVRGQRRMYWARGALACDRAGVAGCGVQQLVAERRAGSVDERPARGLHSPDSLARAGGCRTPLDAK